MCRFLSRLYVTVSHVSAAATERAAIVYDRRVNEDVTQPRKVRKVLLVGSITACHMRAV